MKTICGLPILGIVPMISLAQPIINAQKLLSPDGNIAVSVAQNANKNASYSVSYKGKGIIENSDLGFVSNGQINGRNITKINVAKPTEKLEKYQILNAKKSSIAHLFRYYKVDFIASADTLHAIFAISNEGFAFRYYLPNNSNIGTEIQDELTRIHFPKSTKGFLQPVAAAKTGWEKTNPSYEENYLQDLPVGTPTPNNTGWIYPALFHQDNLWVAVTEAGLDGTYCATRLSDDKEGNYKITFPDAREIINSASHPLLPFSDTAFYTPWRVFAVGSLKTVMESTIGTDVAPAAKVAAALCQPGQSSWSWINSKDDYIVYDEQKKYVDYAADMHWKYCLIDADWDRKIGYDKIAELSAYAQKKNVGLLLWYNSAGDWNTVAYTPKNKLLTHESRVEEFGKLKSMGIKGVKIDFMGGDGRSVIQYYIDILKDAAAYGLMVNFHGATLPRGWARTYPNLLTTEAVKGYEMVTFVQEDANREANHVSVLPFTRNLFDPMDFTPMNLNKLYTQVQRKTTSGFELATSVLLLSGIQHYAESPEGMAKMPVAVKTLLQQIPTHWDDVQFVDGYPGKYAVVARRAGAKWFIAGINGENKNRSVVVNLPILKGKKSTIFSTDTSGNFIKTASIQNGETISLAGNDGFLIEVE